MLSPGTVRTHSRAPLGSHASCRRRRRSSRLPFQDQPHQRAPSSLLGVLGQAVADQAQHNLRADGAASLGALSSAAHPRRPKREAADVAPERLRYPIQLPAAPNVVTPQPRL